MTQPLTQNQHERWRAWYRGIISAWGTPTTVIRADALLAAQEFADRTGENWIVFHRGQTAHLADMSYVRKESEPRVKGIKITITVTPNTHTTQKESKR